MKKNSRSFLCLTIIIIIAGAFFIIKYLPYQNTDAINVARSFINYLKDGKLESAYDLTSMNIYVGRTMTEFRNNTDKDLIVNSNTEITIRDVYPIQTFGNRIKRFLKRTNIELEIINIELQFKVPFRIQLKFIDNKWKITNFGAHAG